jgi:hypothetical protein
MLLKTLDYLPEILLVEIVEISTSLGLRMDVNIVEIRLGEGSQWTKEMRYETVCCRGCIERPCGITSHSQSIPLGVLTAVIETSNGSMRTW